MHISYPKKKGYEEYRKPSHRVAYHLFFLKDYSTWALKWLMEHFHVLLHLSLLKCLPAFIAMHMVFGFLNPKNNSTSSMLTNNIVPATKGFMQCNSPTGYIMLAIPTLYSIHLHRR